MPTNDEQLNSIARLLRASNAIEYKKSVANFEIGRVLDGLFASGGEESISEVARLLNRKGLQVRQEFLYDAFRVFRSIKNEGTLHAIRTRLKGRLPWGLLVHNCVKVPEGDDEAARLYWEQQLSNIENALLEAEKTACHVAEHLGALPESVRPQAEGVISTLGQEILRKEGRVYGPVRRVLHTGDEHFDDDSTLPEVIKSGLHILEKGKQLQPGLVVSSGDLLNSRQSHDSPALRAATAFIKEVAEIAPVFLLKGTTTHDGVSVALLEDLHTKHSVYVAETLGMVGLKNGVFAPIQEYEKGMGLDALIFAIPPANKANIIANGGGMLESNGTVADMLRSVFTIWGGYCEMAKADGVMTIVSAHGTVSGAQTSTGQKMLGKDIEFSLGDLLLINADVACLSHIHKAQAWESERVFYSGSIAKLNVGETEDKGFWLHEKTREGLKSEFVVIPTKDIVSMSFEGLPDLGALPEVKEGSLVRICYKVAEEDIHTVDEAALRARLLALGASEVRIEKSVIPKQMVRASGISKMTSLADKVQKWGETTGTAISDSMKAKLELLQLPSDVLFMELGLQQPQQRRRK